MSRLLKTGIRAAAIAAAVVASAPASTLADDVLKIGFAGGFTGYLAPYDQPTLQGVQLAVDEINKAGGIDGKLKLEVITRDMRSEIAQSAVMAQELVDQGIAVMLAPCDVDPAVAAGQIAQASGIPTIAPCASTPTLPGIVGDYMFANYTADNLQGTVLADFAMLRQVPLLVGVAATLLALGLALAYTVRVVRERRRARADARAEI